MSHSAGCWLEDGFSILFIKRVTQFNKPDRSFVIGIHCDESNLAIVRTIIALSKGLNIKVIAEGIELFT